jgi:hypothetical protein
MTVVKYFKIVSRFFVPFILILIVVLAVSCHKSPVRETTVDPPDQETPASYKNGTLVINEGNFNWGNASVTFINDSDKAVSQDVFNHVNGRSLGDVAQSMRIFNNKGYIVVNNSNKVEVVSMDDFSSLKSISGFYSPRYIEFIDSSKAYVSNLLRNISVVDLNTLTITKSIQTSSWTEGLVKYKNFAFVTSIGTYNEPSSKRDAQVLIIDTKSDEIIDSIKTGAEPIGIVIDKKEKIWVLCSGGYDSFESPTLLRINPDLMSVEKVFTFTGTSGTPSRLCINSGGDTLYFLRNNVYQMSVNATAIPDQPVIASGGRAFYGLGIDPKNGNIFVSDAVDYVQSGYVYQFNQQTGTEISKTKAGRIPGSFCFSRTSGRK